MSEKEEYWTVLKTHYEIMIALLSKHCSTSTAEHIEIEIYRKDSRFQLQLEETVGGSRRHCCMETSDLWTVIYWEEEVTMHKCVFIAMHILLTVWWIWLDVDVIGFIQIQKKCRLHLWVSPTVPHIWCTRRRRSVSPRRQSLLVHLLVQCNHQHLGNLSGVEAAGAMQSSTPR